MKNVILGYYGGYDSKMLGPQDGGYHEQMRRKYTALNEKYGIEFTLMPALVNHDASAVLIIDGKLVAAAEEERFTRVKHYSGTPVQAINYCLDQANISISDVDVVAFGFHQSEAAIAERFLDVAPIFAGGDLNKMHSLVEAYRDDYIENADPRIAVKQFLSFFPEYKDKAQNHEFVSHHLAHAASAFFPSGFDEALVIGMDGIGEATSTSVYVGKGRELQDLEMRGVQGSFGLLYSRLTQFLGFQGHEEEYKVMGLAPYGDSGRFTEVFDSLIQSNNKGQVYIPLNCMAFSERNAYLKDLFKLNPRESESELDQVYIDIAASLQSSLEKHVLRYVTHWQEETGMKNLCLAGGVALNCAMNGVLEREKIFDNIYIQPVSNDAGTSLGAALHAHFKYNTGTLNGTRTQYLGPEFNSSEIEKHLEKYSDRIDYQFVDKPWEEAANLIVDNKVIGWFQGKMEYGPRALGNRSILANPANADMKDIVNSIIKKREGFRPFAPSAMYDRAAEFFEIENGREYPYMVKTVLVREDKVSQLGAVTHENRTARLHTVKKEDNETYWNLLDSLYKRTGIPVVLNTSFNVRGEPIVCTPSDAVNTFLNCGLDALIVGNFLISKKS